MAIDQITEDSDHKAPLSFGDLWNMNFGFLGIQFGWGLQMANMAAIYTKLGADADKIPILGLAGPVTGLLIQPLIGAMSDRTWSAKWGRRRPYFTVGAIAASIVLFLMPSSPALWVAAVTLWLLDASINTSMEPFRAYVADKLPIKQRASGFLMQSFFIGVGATLANVLPSILNHFGISSEASNGVPLSVEYSFRVGAFILLLAVLWTVFKSTENPPADIAAFEAQRKQGGVLSAEAIKEIVSSISEMPGTMKQLFWVQFFTWYGLSCFWSYFTLTVAYHVFGATSSKGPIFDRATEWAGVCMGMYSIVCFIVAPLLTIASKSLGRPRLHALALLCIGIGIASVGLIHSKLMLLAPMVGFGIGWASILALPYAILSVALPKERVGVYMGIFNFFIVLPQMVSSFTLPLLVKYVFNQDPLPEVVIGGACLIVAAAISTRVVEHSASVSAEAVPMLKSVDVVSA